MQSPETVWPAAALALAALAVTSCAAPKDGRPAAAAPSLHPSAADVQPLPGLETRFVLPRGTTPEGLAKNWRPVWKIETGADGSWFEASGDEQGNATGQVICGGVWRIPSPMPRTMTISFEFQALCVSENRVPVLSVHLLTAKAWDKLGKTPETASPWGTLAQGDRLFSGAMNTVFAEDVTEWRQVRTRNLAGALRAVRGGSVVTAVGFTTYHAGGEEWVKVRNIRIETNDAPLAPLKREQRWPLKEERTLRTDAEISLARANCEKHESARELRDGIVKECQRWLELSDAEVLRRIPAADVPRAGNVNANGCPVHGNEVYAGGSCYPWKLDFDKPFTIKCPAGGEVYPSNDFYATYADPARRFGDELKQDHADDGWGWVAPNGDRYWLVGYACHWWWYRLILPGMLNLSRAYLLTGEPQYAHKAALMLNRIADVYPEMDYENQSRYGSLTASAYNGKILNLIWETFTLTQVAEAYDNVFPAIDGDAELHALLGRSGEQIRANIETNLLQEGMDGVFAEHIRGNFGMHQSALITASVVREKAGIEEHVKWLLSNAGGRHSHEGMDYALYNLVYRDGMPFETSPGYCFLWVRKFTLMAEALKKAGVNFYEKARFRTMLDAPLDMVCARTQTPAEGDSGGWQGGALSVDPNVYVPALREYGDPRYAAWLKRMTLDEKGGFLRYELLFGESPARLVRDALARGAPPTPRSRLLPAYGMAILNNRADTLAAAIYYGYKGGHGHFDSLNLHLLDSKAPLMPDTGYPDFMNAFIPGIFTWSKTTIAHNTVTVDRRRQFGAARGRVIEMLADGDLHLATIDNPGVYPEIATRYMRTLLLVETGADSAYLVDLFRVSGGTQHDYSLHGAPGEFTIVSGRFGEPRDKGTLAGADVEVGEFYDDPVLGAADCRGPYSTYQGSGFQHLINVQLQQGAGDVVVEWRPSHPEPSRKLRLHLTGQPGQQAILCDAQVSPVKRKELMKYVIARRTGEELASAYASVIEPYAADGAPKVTAIARLETGAPDAIALRIERDQGADVVCHHPAGGKPVQLPGGVVFNGRFCFLRLDASGAVQQVRAVGGEVRIDGETRAQDRCVTGRVLSVDPARRTFIVALAGTPSDPGALADRTLLVENDLAAFPYRIKCARIVGERTEIEVADADMRSGHCRLKGWDAGEQRLRAANYLPFAGVLRGATATDEGFRHFHRITDASANGFRIEPGDADPAAEFADADGDGATDFWIVDGGPGDRVRIDLVAGWEAPTASDAGTEAR